MIRLLIRTVLVFVATIFLLLVGAVFLLQTSLATTFVEGRLRAWIHPQLQVNGAVQISVFPKLGLELTEVVIPSRDGSHPMVVLDQVQWQALWLPLRDRTVVLDNLYVSGVQLYRPNAGWTALGTEIDQMPLFDQSPLRGWIGHAELPGGSWQVVVQQALLENMTVVAHDQLPDAVPLASVEQFELRVQGYWPDATGSKISAGLRQLQVNRAQELHYVPAFLEQLGIANDDSWDVQAMDSEWQIQGNEALLMSAQVNGSWGQLSADKGSIDLRNGAMSIAVKAILTNAPKFKTRGIEINVHQSRLQFELTGTLKEPGVKWLSPQRSAQ
jgi:hypothetical protein